MKGCVHSRLDILASLHLVYRMHLQKGKKKIRKRVREEKQKVKNIFHPEKEKRIL